ncbi:MAG: DUF5312 domain-containing protein [Treponema sp.]|nr:DUF5312 domain-containing protein [Treponema sp.]
MSGPPDPEAAKKRRLKKLAKELARNRHAYFYKARYGEAAGALGGFFYEIYKVIAPAQVFLQNAAKSAVLKQIVIESFLDKDLEAIEERLIPSSIEERAKTVDIQDLAKSLDNDMFSLSVAFDSEMIKNIDYRYNNILSMLRFIAFDYFSLLKRFDSGIVERNFSRRPEFTNVPGEYLSGDIKDFLEISFGLDPDQDWKAILSILKTYRNGMDVVDPDLWNKILARIQDVRGSGILELMVRHIDKNPSWRFKPKLPGVRIAEKHLEDKEAEIKATVDRIAAAQRKFRRDELVSAVFGSAEIKRARYYTEEAGEIYVRRNFDGFLYAAAFNYLMSFVLDLLRADIQALCELFIIRGKWIAPEVSSEMSEHVYLLADQANKITAFDETFSDMGEDGSRLKTSILKADRDKTRRRFIASILDRANEEALDLIDTVLKSIIIIGRNLSALLEDRRKPTHTLIRNWQELDGTPLSLVQRLDAACKKINAFIRLMYFLTKNSEESPES